MKKRSPHFILCVLLSALLICMILVPCVSAAAKTTTKPTTAPTVPPILQACSHAASPEARFTCVFPANQSSGIPEGSPFPVACTDNSSSKPGQTIVSWDWEFGDGGSSTEQNPLHTYTRAGNYDIRLTVTTFCGRQYSNTTVTTISLYCTVPEPGFLTNVSEGFAPLAVQVTDTSLNTGENSTTWTYWLDNTPYSHDRNPVYIFSTPGTYTISQTVWKDCIPAGSTTYPPFARQILVSPSLSASFNASDTGSAPAQLTTVTTAVPVATTPAAGPEPSGAADAATGTLSVVTEPEGVQLYVDDVLRGTSPVMVGLLKGSHTIRLEKEGYNNLTVPVQINGGKVTEFSTTLKPVESSGIAIIPVIALGIIILGVVGFGIFLYRKQKNQ
ncbi:MAG TPA: PKD domain-containing protein [Methanoregula sp.]|nr:PKD domain-containing protein [Methanoregula sp.]